LKRRAGQEIFGKKGLGYESDQVSLDDAVSFVLRCGNATFGQDSLWRVPKPEPIEINDRDRRYMYRARVLVGDLPIVMIGPLL